MVFVYAAVLMLDAGLKQTLVATGDDTNVIFVRRFCGGRDPEPD